jgi:hypothetical protein
MPSKPEALPAFAQRILDTVDLPPEQREILDQAVACARRLDQITAALDKVLADDEMLVRGERGSLKMTPLLAAERAERDALVRLLRALNLPEES